MPFGKTGKKIAAISSNRKGQQIVVFSDGEKLVLSPNAFTEAPLYVGKEVSPLEMRSLHSFLEREKLMDYGLGLVSKREYSTKEVKDKLLAKAADPALVKEVMFYLKKEGFLNDEEFARDYAESKTALFYGRERILSALRFEKGLNPEILDGLSFSEELPHAKAFLRTLEKKTASLPAKSRRIKLSQMLSRRGFSTDIINQVVDEIPSNSAAVKASLEKEATKAIQRYGKKYNSYNLKQKCFAYLYSKGFSSGEISEVLERKL